MAMHWHQRPALTRRSGSPVPSRKLCAAKGESDDKVFLVTTVCQRSPDRQVSSDEGFKVGAQKHGGPAVGRPPPTPVEDSLCVRGAALANPVDAVWEGMLRKLFHGPCRSPGKQCSPRLDEQVHQSGVVEKQRVERRKTTPGARAG